MPRPRLARCVRALLALLLVAAPLAVPLAAAECPPGFTLEGGYRHVGGWRDPWAVASAAVCVSTPQTQRAERVIPWGADEVQARYALDLGPAVASLNVTLDGLGFLNDTVVLLRQPADVPRAGFVYAMAPVALPGGPAWNGTLNGTLELPARNVTVTYRVAPSI